MNRAQQRLARERTRAILRARIAARMRSHRPQQGPPKRHRIAVTVRLSDDPETYRREYGRLYYRQVIREDAAVMERRRARGLHRLARLCPYPEMTATVAIQCGLRVVSSAWFWQSPPGMDRDDLAQDEVLRTLEAAHRARLDARAARDRARKLAAARAERAPEEGR